MTHCKRGKNSWRRAVDCLIWFSMTSEDENALPTWSSNPCQRIDYLSDAKKKVLSIHGQEYEKYVCDSPLSLLLSYISISDSETNFF